jgi:hypothetical protein
VRGGRGRVRWRAPLYHLVTVPTHDDVRCASVDEHRQNQTFPMEVLAQAVEETATDGVLLEK